MLSRPEVFGSVSRPRATFFFTSTLMCWAALILLPTSYVGPVLARRGERYGSTVMLCVNVRLVESGAWVHETLFAADTLVVEEVQRVVRAEGSSRVRVELRAEPSVSAVRLTALLERFQMAGVSQVGIVTEERGLLEWYLWP